MAASNTLSIPMTSFPAEIASSIENTSNSVQAGFSNDRSGPHSESELLDPDTEEASSENVGTQRLYHEFVKFLQSSKQKSYKLFLRLNYLDASVVRSGFALYSYGIRPRQGEAYRIVTSRIQPNIEKSTPKQQTLSGFFRLSRSAAGAKSKPWDEATWRLIYKVHGILTTDRVAALDLVLLSRNNIFPLDIYTRWQRFGVNLAMKKDHRSKIASKLWISVLTFLNFTTQDLLTFCFKQDDDLPSRLKLCLPSECIDIGSTQNHYFAWPSTTPSSGAFNLYLLQSYRRKPAFDSAAISWIYNSTGNLHKVLLRFDTATDLQRFSSLLDKHYPIFIQCCQITDYAAIGIAILKNVLLVLLQFIIEKHKMFLESVAMNLYSLDMLARNRPGRSKILYLYSLRDYLERQHEQIQQCLDIANGQDIDASPQIPRSKLYTIEDLEYLKVKSFSTKDDLDLMVKRLATFRDFKQAQQNSISGFLIGLYVPLAFVTGFFGMNTTEINGSLWPLSRFWEIALPLAAFTMIMPLIFGATIRFSANLSVNVAKTIATFWTNMYDAMMTVLLVTYLPLITAIDLGPGLLPTLTVFILVQLIRAYGTRATFRFRWWLFVSITAISCVAAAYLFDRTHYTTASLPYVLTAPPFFFWLVSDYIATRP